MGLYNVDARLKPPTDLLSGLAAYFSTKGHYISSWSEVGGGGGRVVHDKVAGCPWAAGTNSNLQLSGC